jgi:hypothetical protein
MVLLHGCGTPSTTKLASRQCSKPSLPQQQQSHWRVILVYGRLQGNDSFRIISRASLPDWAVRDAGAPAEVWLDIKSASDSAVLSYDVFWVNKTATRLPEVHIVVSHHA